MNQRSPKTDASFAGNSLSAWRPRLANVLWLRGAIAVIMGNAIADFKSQPASAANNIIDASFSRQMKFVPF